MTLTDLSDYKKIGIVHKNRQVFDEHYIFIFWSQTRWSMEHSRNRGHHYSERANMRLKHS